jgi:hypothetical protein
VNKYLNHAFRVAMMVGDAFSTATRAAIPGSGNSAGKKNRSAQAYLRTAIAMCIIYFITIGRQGGWLGKTNIHITYKLIVANIYRGNIERSSSLSSLVIIFFPIRCQRKTGMPDTRIC